MTSAFGTEQTSKQWVPIEPADLFRDHAATLKDLYHQLPRNVRGRTETKRRLWLDMLHVSGIAPQDNDADRLFVTHSLLIAIARIVTHTLSQRGKDWKEALKERWTPSTGQLIDVAKWNLLRYLPVKMRGAEDDQEETAKPFASV